MNLDYKQIGKNLARRRKELRLKQYEVCERAGINDKYLSCIETARSIPSLEVFLRLAKPSKPLLTIFCWVLSAKQTPHNRKQFYWKSFVRFLQKVSTFPLHS